MTSEIPAEREIIEEFMRSERERYERIIRTQEARIHALTEELAICEEALEHLRALRVKVEEGEE